MIIWFTGLSGAGKTTLAQALVAALQTQGRAVELLDGDQVRQLLPAQGFSPAAREQHIAYMGLLASRLEAHGVIVVAAFISPYRQSRDFVRSLAQQFVEVHVSTPLAVCEARDSKGLYARARQGQLPEFTGISAPYQAPLAPELSLDTSQLSQAEALETLQALIQPWLSELP